MAAKAETGKRVLGLATGLVFGALLQKGKVARHEVLHDQLTLRDHHVAKVMGTAIAVGAAALWALQSKGLASPEVKPLKVGGVVGGAAMFGAGLAVLGYCPGTSLAAVGEGNRDALVGTLGMLAGAATFVAFYPAVAPAIEAGGDLGKVTLPKLTKTPVWPWVAGLAAAVLTARAFDSNGKGRSLRRLPAPVQGRTQRSSWSSANTEAMTI